MDTYLISLLPFNDFTSGERANTISINPAFITMITQGNRSTIAMDKGEYRPTRIYLIGHDRPIEVAQTIEYIYYLTGDGLCPSQEYVEDRTKRIAS
tara:strand:- start:454 stop:741 length:288 start_codon:yes stop_codon:yes gene_type:complete